MSSGERRLAAIMYTDMVGYTTLTQSNEAQAMEVLERHNRLLRPLFPRFHGREVKAIGDSFLVEFESALDALRCASEIQSYLHDYNVSSKEEWRIMLRIGIHLGDVIHQGGDVFGDAVNIASRIYPLAEPGGVCISEEVQRQVRNKSDLQLVSLGEKSLKNVSTPVEVYKVQMPWERSTTTGASSYPTSRLAILPFTSFSSNPDDAYFADGMTEEIISTVSGIGGLGVISRTSVMRYKGTNKSIKEIGRDLEVGSVLEGSFRKAGNKIRVTAQLIKVADDQHLWAQSYDRNLDDIFEVQIDVAKQVAEALRVRILSREAERIARKPTENTIAYTLYLKGRYHWNKRGPEDTRRAAECFEGSVKEDPGFALGYAGQADCAILLRNNWNLDLEENLKKAKALVTKALELDPELAEAHLIRGVTLSSEYDFGEAEKEFRRAIELKPSYATAHQWYMFEVLAPQRRWDEAQREIEKAVELDPLSQIIAINHGDFYYFKRDYPRSVELYQRALELGSEFAHGRLANLYGWMGRLEDMKREVTADVEFLQGSLPSINLLMDVGNARFENDRQTVRKLLPEVEAHMREAGTTSVDIAGLYLFLDEKDKGFEWLEHAYDLRESSLCWIAVDPWLDGVRNDPRYLDLVKRLGLD